MGVTKKAKITFTCEPDLKDVLEEWARLESRTLSNLVEMVVKQAYETYQKRPHNPTPVAVTAKAKRSREAVTTNPKTTKAKIKSKEPSS